MLTSLRNTHEDLFIGIGNIPSECEIYVKEGSIPRVYKARKIPVVIQIKLKEELEILERLIIIKLTFQLIKKKQQSLLKKDVSVWLCIDPMNLNKYIRITHDPIPTFDLNIKPLLS